MSVMKLRTSLLPMLTLVWVSPSSLLAAGHDCVPIVFNLDQAGKLSLGGKLEEDKKVVGPTLFPLSLSQYDTFVFRSSRAPRTTP